MVDDSFFSRVGPPVFDEEYLRQHLNEFSPQELSDMGYSHLAREREISLVDRMYLAYRAERSELSDVLDGAPRKTDSLVPQGIALTHEYLMQFSCSTLFDIYRGLTHVGDVTPREIVERLKPSEFLGYFASAGEIAPKDARGEGSSFSSKILKTGDPAKIVATLYSSAHAKLAFSRKSLAGYDKDFPELVEMVGKHYNVGSDIKERLSDITRESFAPVLERLRVERPDPTTVRIEEGQGMISNFGSVEHPLRHESYHALKSESEAVEEFATRIMSLMHYYFSS